jgi:hypothetical protein
MLDIYLNLATSFPFATFSNFIEKFAKLSVMLSRSFGVSFYLEIELPNLFLCLTWNVSLHSAKLILIENERILFSLSHYVQNLVFNVSFHKIFQNVKIVFNDNCISIFHVQPVNFV